MAEAYLAAHPQLDRAPDTPLIPPPAAKKDRGRVVADTGAPCWRLMPDGNPPGPDWMAASFDDSSWQPLSLPSKELGSGGARMLRAAFALDDPANVEALALDYATTGRMQVHLNGTLIMDISPGGGRGSTEAAKILLKPSTRELLRTGTNHLAVAVDRPPGNHEFDLALEAAMK
jgi:hypothetical protein